MNYLQLREYDSLGTAVTFKSIKEKDDFQKSLSKMNNEWKKRLGLYYLPFSYDEDRIDLSLRIYCKGVTGFFSINNYFFEVIPKFLEKSSSKDWKVALANLLFLQENPKRYRSNLITSTPLEESLPDLLASIFIDELENGIRLGLPREYIYIKEDSQYYKGSYDIRRAIYHLTKPQFIPIKYEDYVTDTTVNRLLKSAANELSKVVKSPKKSIHLGELASAIDASLTPPTPLEIELIRLPLQFSYLETAVILSKIILKNQSIIFDEGDILNNGFLWDTNTIFENFTKLIVKEICKSNPRLSFSDQSVPLYTLGNIDLTDVRKKGTTYPDIRIMKDGKTKWLLDAKYKIWGKGPLSSDVYQVITGSQVTSCRQASLIYPSSSTTPTEQVFYNIKGMNTPKFLSCMFVNLSLLSEKKGLNKIIADFQANLEEQL